MHKQCFLLKPLIPLRIYTRRIVSYDNRPLYPCLLFYSPVNNKLLEVIFSGTPHALGPTPFIRIPYFSHISALALIKALSWISMPPSPSPPQSFRQNFKQAPRCLFKEVWSSIILFSQNLVIKHIILRVNLLVVACLFQKLIVMILITLHLEVKVKSVLKPIGPPNHSLSQIPCWIKWLGVLLLSPGWDASPLQGYPPAFYQASLKNFHHPFIILIGERHSESTAFCPTTQHSGPARSTTPTS